MRDPTHFGGVWKPRSGVSGCAARDGAAGSADRGRACYGTSPPRGASNFGWSLRTNYCRGCFEHPPRPQKRARIPTKPGLVSTRALSAGSCFIDRPYCAASLKASHRACPALGLATKERYTKICALYPRSQERSLTAHLANANTGIMLLPARFGLLSCRDAGGEFRDRKSLK